MSVAESALQHVKNDLVSLGPRHWAVRSALRVAGFRRGWRVSFQDGTIRLQKGGRLLILSEREYVNVPMLFASSELICCDRVEPDRREKLEIWDYSKPRWIKYRASGLEFFSPALPEEDLFEEYTRWYVPKHGDTVWDVGAHAGFTTYMLSQMVGSSGKVVAWEPDPLNIGCLMTNIERHQLSNVVVVQKALGGRTGTAKFIADGTMGSGFPEFLCYAPGNLSTVDALSLEDACRTYGTPDYIKMDIEGAELAVIEGAVEFLRTVSIRFAIETDHEIEKGRFAYSEIGQPFVRAGYAVKSERDPQSHVWLTWAEPEHQP